MIIAAPGSLRRATIKDVAAKAGVSFKTVARVVNGDPQVRPDLREVVSAALAELDYRPHRAARALRGNRTFAIALLMGSHDEPTGEALGHFPDYLGQVIAGCTQACRPAGYHLVLEAFAYGDQRKAMAHAAGLLHDLAPDGVVLAPPLCDLEWLLDVLDARAIPFARLMPGRDLDRGSCLAVDDRTAARELTRLLLQAGHRELAFISGPADHLAAQARGDGFTDAVAAQPGAKARFAHGDFYLASGERAGRRLLTQLDRPTAVFAANDAMAAGVLKAAADLGLSVPEDVAVVGFDGSLVAELTHPPLTTARQPTAQLARQAAALLIEAAGSGERLPDRIIRLGCTIIQRASTTAALEGEEC